MQERKRELTEAIIAYLLKHGLADLSLRPLAAKTGTSSRLLIYHFESKEGLLTEVLLAMQGAATLKLPARLFPARLRGDAASEVRVDDIACNC